ncbi:16S rRNA (guanine(527)-N(7))-methyltransferase RsmG [Rhodovibrio sodomensis]|uniref:Ribosomal RNA small subunit methyltransferase G n=1 Tax=Rhodovibrio sodomensis TaxID=1088 RepID=A0ABS1DKN0_9PROT|nr:16S rRNA (guanine(527)-N(7))-methyltransferase RsmG [Rhodovibrio sodomensis]MBK1671049.1 16S rRNA (guanine(527)-N(7))-methyltransferase RsmG [Rhodovibrio sodomensis]
MSGPASDPAGYDASAFRRDTAVSRETLARLSAYADLLCKWNKAVNLVGRGTLADLWRRHFLDSAQLADLLPAPPADRPRRVVDLGSGGGFPGLVLAILGAGEVHLVEADGRKAAFLREGARVTGTDVRFHVKRAETLPPLDADVVTARAFAPLADLLGHAAPLLRRDGVGLFPKGKGVEGELTVARKAWNMTVDRIPSRTDTAATILRVEALVRKNAKG